MKLTVSNVTFLLFLIFFVLLLFIFSFYLSFPWNVAVEEKKVKSLQNILDAKTKIKGDITEVKEKLKVAKETIAKFKEEISKIQSGSLTDSPSLV